MDAERAALAGGLAVGAATALVVAAAGAFAPDLGSALVLQLAGELAVGREVGIPASVAAGTHPAAAAAFSFGIHATILLVGYAVAGRAGRALLRFPRVGRLAERALRRRETVATQTERPGIAALAGALWIPFLPTGALASALVGKAAGYPASRLLPALLASTLAADAVWAAFAAELLRLGSPVVWTTAGAFLVASLALALLRRKR